MEKKNLLTKVRTDSRTIIKKLSVYRNAGDIKNYKTSVDSLQILIDLNQRNTVKERYNLDDGLIFRSLLYHDKESMAFFEELLTSINDEVSLISLEMDKSLQLSDLRSYRDLLISFEKLSKIHYSINDDYNSSKRRIELNNIK